MRKNTSWRLRLSAVACMLLLLFGSTAEVAHTHPGSQPLAQNSSQKAPVQPQRNSESVCPLCIAMHSVLPAVPRVVAAPAELTYAARPTPAVSQYVSLWRFELFGRPPPFPVGA